MLNKTFIESCFRYILSNRIGPEYKSTDFEYTENDNTTLREAEYAITLEINDNSSGDVLIDTNISFLKDLISVITCRKVHTRNELLSFIQNDRMEAYKEYIDDTIDSATILTIRKIINKKKRMVMVFKNKKQVRELLNIMENHENIDEHEAYEIYEKTISGLYIDTVIQGTTTSSTDSNNDNLSSAKAEDLLAYMKKSFINAKDRKYFKASRFIQLMDVFKRNAFESKRLYIFGGSPGIGKSTMLMNLYQNFAKDIFTYCVDYNGKPIKKVLHVPIYITLENEIDESIERYLYCYKATMEAAETRSPIQFTTKVSSAKDELEMLQSIIKEVQEKHKYIFTVMKYMKPGSTTINDIITFIQDEMVKLNETIGKELGVEIVPGPILIDYLDHLKPTILTDLYRLELGYVAMDLKILSILYKVPVITVTQMNNYRLNASTVGLDNLNESKKKAEHSDFVALLTPSNNEDEDRGRTDPLSNRYEVTMSVNKNRNGKKDVRIDYHLYGAAFFFKETNSGRSIVNTRVPEHISDNNSNWNGNNNGGFNPPTSPPQTNNYGGGYRPKMQISVDTDSYDV